MFNLSNVRIADVKNEVLAGFVVAVSMIPEAVGFSLVAGLSPIVGLHTAFIIGLVWRCSAASRAWFPAPPALLWWC